MPSTSLTPEEKAKVFSAIPKSSNKIVVAAPARIYFAHPQRDKWSYSGLQGILAFTHDKSKDAFFLKLVDFEGTRGVIWTHELYAQFEYHKDRSFFYSFHGDDCMIGVVFSEDKDATSFYKKVTARKEEKATKTSPEPQKVKKGRKAIDKSMISGPQQGSFKHIAHVGYDEEKGFTSNNVDESWLSLVRNLQGHGVTADVIEENKEFIQDFVRKAQQTTVDVPATAPKKKPPPPPVPRRGGHATSNIPPAPPPPPPGVTPPPPQPGRTDLLASIRGQSVANLRKTPAPSSTPPPAPVPTAEESSNSNGTGGGGDLTAALAAALLQRSKKLGDSDDEDEDDDEWD
ncbi:PH domain-like protein [Imleria badia]|nr:PH domain-like protein [Imleria badia]